MSAHGLIIGLFGLFIWISMNALFDWVFSETAEPLPQEQINAAETQKQSAARFRLCKKTIVNSLIDPKSAEFSSYNEHTDQLKLDCANVRVRMISGCVSHQAGRGSLFYGQVNAKNRFGGYSGWRSFACFADEREAGIQFIDSCVYEVDGQRIYLC